jgi:hypothetical protein
LGALVLLNLFIAVSRPSSIRIFGAIWI